VSDFFGDGASVYAGINWTADPRNGRLLIEPAPGVAGVNSKPLGQIALAKNGLFIGEVDASKPDVHYIGPCEGNGDCTRQQLASIPFLVTGHHEHDGVFYATTASHEQITQDTIFVWDPPAQPTVALAAGLGWHVRSLSVSATGMVALAENPGHDALTPGFQIVRPPAMQGGGQYEVVASLNAPVSNVVLDGDASFVVESVGNELVIERFEGKDLQSSDGVKVGSFERHHDGPGAAYLAADDTYIYVADGAVPQCKMDPCSTDLVIIRIRKDGSGYGIVKSFNGPAPAVSSVRPFAIDDCYFIWYDAAQAKLFRQPKASL
jgi:hypothetical protein